MQDEYFYQLVCVDNSNPLEFRILVDECIDDLDQIQDIIQKYKDIYIPEFTKWILTPFKKINLKVRREPT